MYGKTINSNKSIINNYVIKINGIEFRQTHVNYRVDVIL